MHSVEKKKKRSSVHSRWIALGTALLVLLGSAAVLWQTRRNKQDTLPEPAITYGEVMQHEEAQVERIAVTLRSGDSWSIRRDADGTFREAEDGFLVDTDVQEQLLRVTAVISYEDVLTEDAEEYRAHLADFGLDTPRVIAKIDYEDGASVTLRIGDESGMEDEAWAYMTVDGDDRLYAVSSGNAEELMQEKALLHPVIQPTLHKARMDAITFADGAGETLMRWQLAGEVTDADADSSWQLMAPWQYPADEEAMTNLRANLSNIRLGAYMGEATAENLTRCGFDEPRFNIIIHQAAAATNATDDDGKVTQVDWPESTFAMTVGGAKNDNVDYVRVEDSIYLTSHYSLNVFMSLDVLNTVSRYPVMVAVGNLQSLTIANDAGETIYRITREAKVGENNEMEKDAKGNVTYDTTCTRNGETIAYEAFEAAYIRMETAKVSGRLPDGWTTTEKPHTTMTFVSNQGQTHVVTLTRFDALHDALSVDGYTLFYIINGGLALDMA